MKREYTGYCRNCRKYGSVPDGFNERKNDITCPECGEQCFLTYQSLEKTKKDLMLGKSEMMAEPVKIRNAKELE